MEFRLLRPEEVVERWGELRVLLVQAVAQGRGEVEVDDIRSQVINGRTFVFGGFVDGVLILAVTADFAVFPRKVVMVVGFGSGEMRGCHEVCFSVLEEFARRAGATSIQTYCRNPAMVRYHQHHFGAEVAYTVLEKKL